MIGKGSRGGGEDDEESLSSPPPLLLADDEEVDEDEGPLLSSLSLNRTSESRSWPVVLLALAEPPAMAPPSVSHLSILDARPFCRVLIHRGERNEREGRGNSRAVAEEKDRCPIMLWLLLHNCTGMHPDSLLSSRRDPGWWMLGCRRSKPLSKADREFRKVFIAANAMQVGEYQTNQADHLTVKCNRY